MVTAGQASGQVTASRLLWVEPSRCLPCRREVSHSRWAFRGSALAHDPEKYRHRGELV